VNKPKRFALTAFAVFVLTVAAGLLVAPNQDAATIVYIMIAVVLPAPVAYFLVYLDGFDRVNPLAEPTANGDEHRNHRGRDGDDTNGDETDVEPTQ